MFKGKLTYTVVAGILAAQVGKLLGVDVAESEVVEVIQAGLAVAAIYGRWRATKA